ncbi:MAG TPA: hypothetical protein VHX16_01420 [Chloroflexota bacterium]|jgi:hypothetical protein|nr:hypothetical protein [Chloroflexota bacterium]
MTILKSPTSPTAQAAPVGWQCFNVHERIRMGVALDAPTAPQTATMFADFRDDDEADVPADDFDLTVSGQLEDVRGVAYAEEDFAYRPNAIYLRSPRLQIIRDGDRIRLNGGGELLTTILPLLDRMMVERGAAMIHAATVTFEGRGIALPAAGGVGKTSTIAKLVRRPGIGFMGDDWAFLTASAELLGFAKPMFIKPHHRPIYPHLFNRTRKPLVPKSLSRPVGQLTTIVHPAIVRYPKLAAFIRKWSPEHMMIPPAQALPNVPMVRSAPLTASVYVERHDGSAPELRDITRDDMVARMLGNFHSEMTVHSREIVNLLGAVGMIPLQKIFAEKAAVLDQALTGIPTFLLQVPRAWTADRASDAIVAELETVLAGSTSLGVPSGEG